MIFNDRQNENILTHFEKIHVIFSTEKVQLSSEKLWRILIM